MKMRLRGKKLQKKMDQISKQQKQPTIRLHTVQQVHRQNASLDEVIDAFRKRHNHSYRQVVVA